MAEIQSAPTSRTDNWGSGSRIDGRPGSAAAIAMLQNMDVTRIFVDPEIDPVTGDVHGAILRLAAHN